MQDFLEKNRSKIKGTLSCFDRLLFRGYLPLLCGAQMAGFLNQQRVRFRSLKEFLTENSLRLKEHALRMAQEAGRPYLYLGQKIPMERQAREMAARDGIQQGLVCVYSILQPCRTFSFKFQKGYTFAHPSQRKCLHLYYYFMEPDFGLIHVKVQTWFPLTIQVYVNGQEWLARKLTANRIATEFGQLGDDSTTRRLTPVQVSGLTGAVSIAAGGDHTCAVKSDQTVWCWGYNGLGQLGDTSTTDRWTPVQVSGLTGAVSIAAGAYHACAIKSDQTAWCWGLNRYGQLGDDSTTDRWTPVQVWGLTGAVSIAAGIDHTCAVKSDQTVWCWGYNVFGQLGDDSTTDRWTPVKVLGFTGATAIDAGSQHTCAIKFNGTAWCWGWNDRGQLGDGTTTQRMAPVQVAIP